MLEPRSQTPPVRLSPDDPPVAVEVVEARVAPDKPADVVVDLVAEPTQVNQPNRLVRSVRGMVSAVEWVFGCVTLIVGLAVLATIPVLQLLSLGYLLEVSGRIVRQGRLSAGFVGVRKAARVGGVVLGFWLLLWPLRFVSSLLTSSMIIDPQSEATRNLTVWLVVLGTVLVAHTASALWRGGKLRHFFWPAPFRLVKNLCRPSAYAEARDCVWNRLTGLRLPYYFWLGARGFAGGLLILAVPVTLLAVGRQVPLVGFLGGLLLTIAVLYLPFLQTHFASQNRFGAMFELRAVRRVFSRAPIAFFVALFVTLLFALPLYLLKIEITPREAAWLPSLLFVVFIFPARMLTGWACLRGTRRDVPRHWVFRHTARLMMLPVVVVYALITFSTQYVSWYGIWSLYEQHAFLLPVPFLGM